MRVQSLAVDLAIGLVAGCIATRLTDLSQPPLSQATPESEKAREPEEPDGGSAMSAADKATGLAGVNVGHKDLQYLKIAIHYGLGASWGGLYVLLRRRGGMGALGAGAATGLALSVLVDECLNPALNITPPNRAYPASSHLRGLVAHLIYGLGVAAAGEVMHRAVKQRWRWG